MANSLRFCLEYLFSKAFQSNWKIVDMESDISKFIFSKYFNYLTYIGVWPADTNNSLKMRLYKAYQMLCFVTLYSLLTIQTIDFWIIAGNLERMTSNMSTSIASLITIFKITVLLLKKTRLDEFRHNLWHDYYRFDEEEDKIIKKAAVDEMAFVAKTFHAMAFVFYPVHFLITFFGYSRKSKELPFPLELPINYDNPVAVSFIWLFEFVTGLIVVVAVLGLDLFIYGIFLQLIAQFKILNRKILKLNEFYDLEDSGKQRKEINFQLKQNRIKKFLKDIITRQLVLIDYVKTFEYEFNSIFFVQIFGMSTLIIMDGFQVLKNALKINAKLVFQMAYLTGLIADVCLVCLYATALKAEHVNIADAAYSTSWYRMDVQMQKFISMVILQAKRPPKLTAGKFISLDSNTFLRLLNATYGWLMLIWQLENK